MEKKFWKKNPGFFWFGLCVITLLFFSFPKGIAEKWQITLVSFIFQRSFPNLPEKRSEEKKDLQAIFLSQEVHHLKNVLYDEMELEEEIKNAFDKGFLKEKKNAYRFLLEKKIMSIPARIIFLFPSRSSRSFWIDVGSEINDRLHQTTLSVGSPVVIGSTLIGVVDLVGLRESRVKHIQDPSFNVAVQTKRGDQFLAKGFLEGVFDDGLLRGEGFNADFEDPFSDKRDLRTGRKEGNLHAPAFPILAPGDTLFTSGLDGIFPKGLEVGRVIDVSPLREGDVAYKLAAEAKAPFNSLETVWVLPPLIQTKESL